MQCKLPKITFCSSKISRTITNRDMSYFFPEPWQCQFASLMFLFSIQALSRAKHLVTQPCYKLLWLTQVERERERVKRGDSDTPKVEMTIRFTLYWIESKSKNFYHKSKSNCFFLLLSMLSEGVIQPLFSEVHVFSWEQQASNEAFSKNHILTCYSMNQNWFSASCLCFLYLSVLMDVTI